ncbi:MAG: hypothetical protein ACI4SO_06720 [Muribaculaceae bacterium]
MPKGLKTEEEKRKISEYNKRYYQLHKKSLKEKRDSQPEYLKERRKMMMLMYSGLRYRLDKEFRRERKAYQRTWYRRNKMTRLALTENEKNDAKENTVAQVPGDSD